LSKQNGHARWSSSEGAAKEKGKGKFRQEKFHERHAELEALNVVSWMPNHMPQSLKKNCGDLLLDDGDAKKIPAIDLAESSSDEDRVELLGHNTLCSDDGGRGGDADRDSSSSELELD
jgi:hypothetical protein